MMLTHVSVSKEVGAKWWHEIFLLQACSCIILQSFCCNFTFWFL